MELLDYNYLFKCLIIGDSSVGKTAMLNRFSDNVWNPAYISTIGVDFRIKTIEILNIKKNTTDIVKLQIWDTAGQERFRTITTSYYRGAHIILLCFDLTNMTSFNSLDTWLKEIKINANNNVKIVLCGNKSDCLENRVVLSNDINEYCKYNDLEYFENSSKLGTCIENIFSKSAEKVIEKFNISLKIEPIVNKQVLPGNNLKNNNFIKIASNNISKKFSFC